MKTNHQMLLHRSSATFAVTRHGPLRIGQTHSGELIPALVRLAVLDWEPPKSVKVLSRIGDLISILANACADRGGLGPTGYTRTAPPQKVDPAFPFDFGTLHVSADIEKMRDGQTLLEAAFDGTSGQGRDLGIVIVKSAGNERPHHGHAHVTGAVALAMSQRASRQGPT